AERRQNIRNVQKSNDIIYTDNQSLNDFSVEMETGTGKTYVYTRVMYELHKNYGFNKFIILVPSTPIKEGTRKFIESDFTRKHFNDLYPEAELKLEVLNPQKNKKGKKMFPSAISNFSRATRLEKNIINSILISRKMLLSKPTMDTSFDQTLFGSTTIPIEALRESRPVVIIDEPHRFKKDNKAYKKLVEEIKPQAIIRFGATFPKNDKTKVIDYNNLVYNLNAVKSFNDGLVKGVAIQTPENNSNESAKIKLLSITTKKPKVAIFRNEENKREYTINLGESLSDVTPEFRGITLEKVGKLEEYNIAKGAELSNGTIIAVGEKIYSNIFSDNYQDIMLKQAIKNHLKQERANFNRERKIKTLSLFFIDSVYSYRGEENDGYLKTKFESFLKLELEKEIEKLSDTTKIRELEYKSFLEASLKDIKATNGGYFAVDNSTDDDKIKEEIDAILRDKVKMLSFKHKDGSWNTRRFIFSKWTLREGWDNPNVFQIAKLRSSGSEISKLQEVGRGLRLPVDEYGNRISNEEFYLTYLIDYSEQDFANTLVNEINSDVVQSSVITDSDLERVAKTLNTTADDLFDALYSSKFIDRKSNIIIENRNEFFNKYPEFNTGLKPNKVGNKETLDKKGYVGIRENNFKKLRPLWESINKKYYLKLDDISDAEIHSAIMNILYEGIYSANNIAIIEKKLVNTNENMSVKDGTTGDYHELNETIPYNKFLKTINKQTGFSITTLHKCFVEFSKTNEFEKDYFNKKSLANFINKYQLWLEQTFRNRFSYTKMNVKINETALTTLDGLPKEKIIQGKIGVIKDDQKIVPEKFLFDSFVYDSELEKATIERSKIDEIVVFGKIPRKSIQVPLYFGGTTSPDFMYIIQRENGKPELNLIIETKDVQKDSELRTEEQLRIESAKKFFEALKQDGLNVTFKKQMKQDEIIKLINEIVE
ncbi:type III restriction-modification system endonuclease, partial [uncultured Gemella sp.]|uniref:type III restriction-modification system endonuclease n=1 Tax=uncultured Gemella sp. TaxID=254352 RepID=UPI00261BD2D5